MYMVANYLGKNRYVVLVYIKKNRVSVRIIIIIPEHAVVKHNYAEKNFAVFSCG